MLAVKIRNYIFFCLCIAVPIKVIGQHADFSRPAQLDFRPDHLAYLQTNKNKTASEVMHDYRSGLFRPIESKIFNAGIPKSIYWIHFSVSSQASKKTPLIIEINNSRINEMQLFEAASDTVHDMGKLGDFYPFSRRAVLYKTFIYPDTLQPDQTKEYFLSVNQIGHAFMLPVKVYTPQKFESETFKDYLFDGITYGILLFVALFSFSFFLSLRYNLYLYYSLYIVTAILWFVSYFGLGYQYLWGEFPALNTSMSPLMACLNIVLNMQICQILLRLFETNRLLNKIINFLKCLMLGLAVYPLFINLNNQGYALNHTYLLCFLFTILLAMMVVSYIVVSFAVRGIVIARVYLIASLLKAGSIINLALLELGITPAMSGLEGLLQLGIFVEISLLTYALALRYKSFRAKTFARVIEAHENERSVISREIHDGIANSLTAINYELEDFDLSIQNLTEEEKMELESILDKLKKVQSEARNISHNTMPEYIAKSTITEIVEKYINAIQTKKVMHGQSMESIKINFSANEQKSFFSKPVKLNLFRIIQEILTNILKHSKATRAEILLSFSKKELIIIVEDNGVGFVFTENKNEGDGIGIKNIRTRVELLDGAFSIKSPVNKRRVDQADHNATDATILFEEFGTLIKIKIPYRNNLLKNATGYEY